MPAGGNALESKLCTAKAHVIKGGLVDHQRSLQMYSEITLGTNFTRSVLKFKNIPVEINIRGADDQFCSYTVGFWKPTMVSACEKSPLPLLHVVDITTVSAARA